MLVKVVFLLGVVGYIYCMIWALLLLALYLLNVDNRYRGEDLNLGLLVATPFIGMFSKKTIQVEMFELISQFHLNSFPFFYIYLSMVFIFSVSMVFITVHGIYLRLNESSS